MCLGRLAVRDDLKFCAYFPLQIEVTFPEDSMQTDRKFVWARDAETTESFDLRRFGLNCEKEFEVDIVFSCRFVLTDVSLV